MGVGLAQNNAGSKQLSAAEEMLCCSRLCGRDSASPQLTKSIVRSATTGHCNTNVVKTETETEKQEKAGRDHAQGRK